MSLWLFSVLFFAYQFILRLSPAIFIDDILKKFSLDVADFGLLAGFYYLGYAGMQLPVGVLLDRFGVRKVVAVGAFMCAIGTLAIILEANWKIALGGRFLVGLGSAAGALGSLKAARIAFEKEQVERMVGWSVTIGLMGAIYGKKLIHYIYDSLGFIFTNLLFSAIGIIIGAALLVLSVEYADNDKAKNHPLTGLFSLLRNPRIYILSVMGAMLVGPLAAFADLWGDQFFMKIYNFNKYDAGELSSMSVYLGMSIGSPLLTTITSKLNVSRYKVLVFCGALMVIIFYALLNKIFSSYSMIFFLMVLVGVACAYQVVLFAEIINITDPSHNGAAISLVNMFNMMGGFAFHYIITKVLNYYWEGEYLKNIKIYPAIAYSDSLYIIPIALIFGTLGLYIIRPRKNI